MNRKRNAHGAMVVGAHSHSQIGRGNTSSKYVTQSPIRGIHRRYASSSEQRQNGNTSTSTASRRPSVDVVTDEEEEGVSTSTCTSASLPPLTDSSSATSSLASSHRSARDSSNSLEDGDSSFLEDVSFSTTTTTTASDTSLPFDQGLGHIRRTSSTGHKLNVAESGRGEKRNQRSPHFKNVRPLQAAFMNSGLLSKKSRSRAERDSGIGMGMTPPFLKRLVGGSVQGTPQSIHSSPGIANVFPGSPIPILNIPKHLSKSTGSPVVVEQPHMPDTPCKRLLFSHSRIGNNGAGSTTTNNIQQLHPLAQTSRPVATRSSSSCSTTSDVSSVVNSMPGSAVKSHSHLAISPRSTIATGGSPTSISSPCADPSINTGSSEHEKQFKRPVPLRLIRPSLFRRRSSGQLNTGPDGSFLPPNQRSGGSTRSGMIDWEPMTPTRTMPGTQWLGGERKILDLIK